MRNGLIIFLVLFANSIWAQNPTIKGGLTSFISQKILYPQYSAQHCIQGKVNIGFKVNERGEVYYTTITKSVISELDKEALRLIKLTNKKWTVPAGYDTTSLLVVPVNFILSSHDCNTTSQADVMMAIANYNKDEQLEKSVTNYYKALEKGTAERKDEGVFLAYKRNLGIDDDYLQDRINMGLKKIKQGDKNGACEDFNYVKYMGSNLADKHLEKYCK